MNKTGL